MVKQHVKFLLLLTSLIVSISIVHAENDSSTIYPDYYPSYFDRSGLVTAIDTDNKQLIFGLVHFDYDQNVKVSTLSSQFGTIESINPGDEIGFSTKIVNGQLKIIKIWQLPSGTVVRP